MKNQKIYCSHRGFNTIAPENTLPAFAVAVSLGTQEIELDLWPTKDGHLLVCHDSSVDRTSNGVGSIVNLTRKQILEFDAGNYFSEYYSGLKFAFFEEVLEQFGNKVIINIHIKSLYDDLYTRPIMQHRLAYLRDTVESNYSYKFELLTVKEDVIKEYENRKVMPYNKSVFEKIIKIIYEYKCEKSVYITGEKDVMMTACELAPEISRCCLEGHMNFSIVENALEYDCERVQFCKFLTTINMVEKAQRNGLLTNLFWSNNFEEAEYFFNNGIDVILTDNYLNTVVSKG